jgi:hypothetical protein
MGRTAFIGSVILVLGLAIGLWFASPTGHDWMLQRRADRTADRFAKALVARDSAALARLAASGSAHNLLCALRHWPPEYWTPAVDRPLRRVGWPGQLNRDSSGWHYRFRGQARPPDSLVGMDFWIAVDPPTRVRSFSVQSSRRWPTAFETCLRPGGA